MHPNSLKTRELQAHPGWGGGGVGGYPVTNQ